MENEADSTPVAAAEDAPAASVAPAASSAAAPAAPQPAPAPAVPAFDPRRRIRELLSIPERDRTDEEWDELNELEIQTAPGNRIGNQPFAPYNPRPGGGGGGGGGANKNRNKNKGPRKPGGGKPFQGKPNNKPPRPA